MQLSSKHSSLLAKKELILLLFVILFASPAYGHEYYRKHIIVLVDQTPDIQGPANSPTMVSIYQFLKESFLGHSPSMPNSGYTTDLTIDPQQDQLSIFGFGLEGGWSSTKGMIGTDYPRLHNMSRQQSSGTIYNEFKKSLIGPQFSLHQTGMPTPALDDFLQNTLAVLCGINGHSGKYWSMSASSAVTFSYYVYPLILDPQFIDKTTPTEQYIVLVISNYRSGLDDKGTSEDITRLEEMLSEQGGNKPHCNFINNEMAKLKRPFFQIPTTNIKFGNNIQIDGFQLGLKSLQGVSAYITSNIVLHETGPDETTYNLNEVNISFNKDEALHVDSLVLKLLDNESKIIFSQKLPNYSYDELAQSYHVDAMENVDLYRVFKDGDALSFRYMIYATANDENGQTILPLVFSAERDYKITEDSLISPAYAKKMFIIKFMLYIRVSSFTFQN